MMTRILDFLFYQRDDADFMIEMIRRNKIIRGKRLFFLTNRVKIIFSVNKDVCIVKYGNDIVPLFIFQDKNSIDKILCVLENGGKNDGSSEINALLSNFFRRKKN
jgi:hypothetical protein